MISRPAGRSSQGVNGDRPRDGLPTERASPVWVARHLGHVRGHLPDVVAPAEHAVSLRRPWWR